MKIGLATDIRTRTRQSGGTELIADERFDCNGRGHRLRIREVRRVMPQVVLNQTCRTGDFAAGLVDIDSIE
jgi:hypothetical protein